MTRRKKDVDALYYVTNLAADYIATRFLAGVQLPGGRPEVRELVAACAIYTK